MRPPASTTSLLGVPPRLRRERLAAWGEGGVKRLRNLGLDVEGCAVDDSRAVFVPDGRLALRLPGGGVEVALHLGPGDLEAPRVLLADAVGALELTAALEALPEQFSIALEDDPRRTPAPGTTSDALRALLERAEREQTGLWLGWAVPADLAAEHAATLDEQLQDAVVALGEVLQLLRRALAARGGAHRHRRRDAARARKDDERESGERRGRLRARERDRERDGEREAKPPREVPAEADESGSRPRAPGPLPRRAALLRRAGGRGGIVAGPIEKGTRVRVLSGAFMGKAGLVQEVDGEGGARVLLVLLAVRIDVKDLARVAEGRARPLLSSSHRKPLPVRS